MRQKELRWAHVNRLEGRTWFDCTAQMKGTGYRWSPGSRWSQRDEGRRGWGRDVVARDQSPGGGCRVEGGRRKETGEI